MVTTTAISSTGPVYVSMDVKPPSNPWTLGSVAETTPGSPCTPSYP
jgi:hypothetical protein